MAPYELILEAARAIRAHLPELLGAEAPVVDARLAALLTSAEPDVDVLILREMDTHPATRQWFTRFASRYGRTDADGRDIEKTGTPPLGGGPPPGFGEAVPAQRMVCPQADFVWYRHVVGEVVPRCPTHDVPLVRQPAL